VTSGGVFAGIDLGLRLVERFFGPKIRAGLETEVEYERRGPNWASRPTITERSG
jgi:transcriptional regulator GlxA family with amidase domain